MSNCSICQRQCPASCYAVWECTRIGGGGGAPHQHLVCSEACQQEFEKKSTDVASAAEKLDKRAHQAIEVGRSPLERRLEKFGTQGKKWREWRLAEETEELLCFEPEDKVPSHHLLGKVFIPYCCSRMSLVAGTKLQGCHGTHEADQSLQPEAVEDVTDLTNEKIAGELQVLDFDRLIPLPQKKVLDFDQMIPLKKKEVEEIQPKRKGKAEESKVQNQKESKARNSKSAWKPAPELDNSHSSKATSLGLEDGQEAPTPPVPPPNSNVTRPAWATAQLQPNVVPPPPAGPAPLAEPASSSASPAHRKLTGLQGPPPPVGPRPAATTPTGQQVPPPLAGPPPSNTAQSQQIPPPPAVAPPTRTATPAHLQSNGQEIPPAPAVASPARSATQLNQPVPPPPPAAAQTLKTPPPPPPKARSPPAMAPRFDMWLPAGLPPLPTVAPQLDMWPLANNPPPATAAPAGTSGPPPAAFMDFIEEQMMASLAAFEVAAAPVPPQQSRVQQWLDMVEVQ